MARPTRVLFVCLGNICRSPTAHGVFLTLLEQRDLRDVIEVDSCGTGGWHVGNPPDERAVAAAAERGYDLSALRARQLQATDFEYYDYLLAMDHDNLEQMLALCPAHYKNRVSLLLDFAPASPLTEVPDPYYGGVNGFAQVLDLVEAACNGLLQTLTAGTDRDGNERTSR